MVGCHGRLPFVMTGGKLPRAHGLLAMAVVANPFCYLSVMLIVHTTRSTEKPVQCSTWDTSHIPQSALMFHVEHCLRQLLPVDSRSEEHTSELQSRGHLVCR